jgi:SAM-dependent methyltransferase
VSDRVDSFIEPDAAGSSGAIPFFDAFAEEYLAAYSADSLGGYVLRTRRARVLELLGGSRGRVLDVGCGPGAMTAEILDAGCEFWGVDGSPRMIAAGRRRFSGFARAHFGVADAMALPFADAAFDAALCIGVIDRMPRPEAAVAELSRVLRSHGTLVISFANLLSPYALWRSHVFYAGVGYAKRLWACLGNGRRGLDLCSAATLWTPQAARGIVESLVGQVQEVTYYNYAMLLSPLDDLLPGPALVAARRFERLRTTRLGWLGAGFLVKAKKGRP